MQVHLFSMTDAGNECSARQALLRCAAAFGHHSPECNSGQRRAAQHHVSSLPVKMPPPGPPGHLNDPIRSFDATQECRHLTPQRCHASMPYEQKVGECPGSCGKNTKKRPHWDEDDDDDIDHDAMLAACSSVEISAAQSMLVSNETSPIISPPRHHSVIAETPMQHQAEHPASSPSQGSIARPLTAHLLSESKGQICHSARRERSRSRGSGQPGDRDHHHRGPVNPACEKPLPPSSDVSCGPFLQHCGVLMLKEFERIPSWQDGVQLLQQVLPQSRFPAQLVAANADVHWQHSVYKLLSVSQKALLAQVPEAIKYALLQLLLVCPKLYREFDVVLADIVECWPIIHAYGSLR